MSDDLVKRLRKGDHFEKVMSAEQAADRIEELEAKLAGGSFYQEKDIDALQDRIEAQAAEIERLNIQCEGLFQAAMNNGQALIKERSDEVQAAVAAALREAADLSALGFHPRDILTLITEGAQAALDRYVKERSDEVVAAERERWQNMSMVDFANQKTSRSIADIRKGQGNA